MPLDPLPSKLITPTRDQIAAQYRRDYGIRNPDADTSAGNQPYLDSFVFADSVIPLYSDAVVISNNTTRAGKTGKALDEEAIALGTQRQDPRGSSGFVKITASSGGTNLVANDELKVGSIRYKTTVTALYTDGDQVPVAAIDTGPNTDQRPGVILTWTVPRPGCGPTCSVVAQADGSGLSGGADVEQDDALRLRLDQLAANPPASGNESEYQKAISETPGISVQASFDWAAIKGSGTKAVAFTLTPSKPGANRIPNAAQRAAMLTNLKGQMPGDDGIFNCSLVASPVSVVLKVTWAPTATGWADAAPWPPYYTTPNLVAASADAGGTLSATQFRLSSASLATAPQVGQTIAFFDLASLAFRRKRLLTVTTIAGTIYDVTVDTSNAASDTGYTPTSGQVCCPWSDSLDDLTMPVVRYFDTLGPGEQVASFFDPGLRQRRQPASPQYWPSVITNRLLGGPPLPGTNPNAVPPVTLITLSSLEDVVLSEPTVPHATPVGAAGVSANLLTLAALVAFPQ